MDLKGKNVVITGIIPGLSRDEVIQIVELYGGKIQLAVTKSTNALIVGNTQIDMFDLTKVSKKRQKVNQLRAQGFSIEVISCDLFLSEIGKIFT